MVSELTPEILKLVPKKSFFSKNSNILYSLSFMIINTLSILFIFNNNFFNTYDIHILNVKFILIMFGIFIPTFFISLKFIGSFSIKKIIVIFVITRVLFLFYFTILNYSVDINLQQNWLDLVHHVLNGDLFSPYATDPSLDLLRTVPPFSIWWYCYNYIVYELNSLGWRIMNFLLEIAIIYTIIKIYYEIILGKSDPEKKQYEENFKIGLLFYIFSIFTLVGITLYAEIIALPVLLGLSGILYYLRYRNDPKNLFYSIFFFTLCALTLYLAFIWLLVIFLLLAFQKKYKHLIVGFAEFIGLFFIICAPLLINNPLGFLQRMFLVSVWPSSIPNISIWLTVPEIVQIMLMILIIGITIFYIYKNHAQTNILDLFMVTISISIIYMAVIYPWDFIWLLSLMCINLIYSIKKFWTINLLFMAYLFLYLLYFAIFFLIYPFYLDPNYYYAFLQILSFLETGGLLIPFQILTFVFQIFVIYLIHLHTRSKGLLFLILFPIVIQNTIFFLNRIAQLIYF